MVETLERVRLGLPFGLRALDVDNGSEFVNDKLIDYCLGHGIELTRSRSYTKNDQAWVEQKNGAIVRKLLGYRRFEGAAAARAIARLFGTSRLFVNFFQPQPLLPILLPALERNGHLKLQTPIHDKLLVMSTAPADRLLRAPRSASQTSRRRHIEPAPKRRIPVRTFSGCAPLVVREGGLVVEAVMRIRLRLPIGLGALDVDNGSELVNDKLIHYCSAVQSSSLARARTGRTIRLGWSTRHAPSPAFRRVEALRELLQALFKLPPLSTSSIPALRRNASVARAAPQARR